MAGIVQQLMECRNAAVANSPTKKRGREGDPGHAFCQKEETFATPGRRMSFAADIPSKSLL